MNNNIISTDTKIGTLNGTLLVLLYSISASDIVRSCILAATGAAVSFIVSLMCKWVAEKFKKGKTNC